MKLHEIKNPQTVADLKALLAELPDDLRVSQVNGRYLRPLKLSVAVHGKARADHNTLVSRGGVKFVGFH